MRLTTPNFLSSFLPLLLPLLLCTLLLLLAAIPSVKATLSDTAPKIAQDLQTWADKIGSWTNTSTPTPCKAFVHAFTGPGKRVGITSNWITRIAISSSELDRKQSGRVVLGGVMPVAFNQLEFEKRISQKVCCSSLQMDGWVGGW